MKHPLTSKERRGLAAIAAAALLCIAAGPVMRSCGAIKNNCEKIENTPQQDASQYQGKSDKSGKSEKSKSQKKSKKARTKKTIPVRSPLDQPCDQ